MALLPLKRKYPVYHIHDVAREQLLAPIFDRVIDLKDKTGMRLVCRYWNNILQNQDSWKHNHELRLMPDELLLPTVDEYEYADLFPPPQVFMNPCFNFNGRLFRRQHAKKLIGYLLNMTQRMRSVKIEYGRLSINSETTGIITFVLMEMMKRPYLNITNFDCFYRPLDIFTQFISRFNSSLRLVHYTDAETWRHNRVPTDLGGELCQAIGRCRNVKDLHLAYAQSVTARHMAQIRDLPLTHLHLHIQNEGPKSLAQFINNIQHNTLKELSFDLLNQSSFDFNAFFSLLQPAAYAQLVHLQMGYLGFHRQLNFLQQIIVNCRHVRSVQTIHFDMVKGQSLDHSPEQLDRYFTNQLRELVGVLGQLLDKGDVEVGFVLHVGQRVNPIQLINHINSLGDAEWDDKGVTILKHRNCLRVALEVRNDFWQQDDE